MPLAKKTDKKIAYADYLEVISPATALKDKRERKALYEKYENCPVGGF